VTVARVIIDDALTVDEAAAALVAARAAIDAGCHRIDLGGLKTVDSAAVATLIAIQRYASSRGVHVEFVDVPEALVGLAHLYEVDTLLGVQGR